MEILNGYPVIGDDYRVDPNLDGEFGTGYEERDYASYPLGGLKCARMYEGPRYDLATIKERTREKTAKKQWISDRCDLVGSKVKNQSSSSYCWIHAPVRAMECKYILMGGKVFVLSAFWPGARIKNGRNQGGSGIVGVKYLAEHGTCVESMCPPLSEAGNAAFRPDRDPAHEANAAMHQIVTWDDFDPSDKLAIWSAIIDDHAVTVGIPAWGHEVCLTFLVLDGDTVREGFDNSWKYTWGNNGRGVLSGNKQRFDEAGRVGVMEPAAA